MPESVPSPLLQTLRWLSTHAGYPAGRLPDRAELLLLIATAAATAEVGPRHARNAQVVRNVNFSAQIRNYTAQRRRAHVKCDNSAKT